MNEKLNSVFRTIFEKIFITKKSFPSNFQHGFESEAAGMLLETLSEIQLEYAEHILTLDC